MTTQKPKITFSTDDLLSVPQVAREIGVHFSTVYRWIYKGMTNPYRIAGQAFITVDDVKALRRKEGKTVSKIS